MRNFSRRTQRSCLRNSTWIQERNAMARLRRPIGSPHHTADRTSLVLIFGSHPSSGRDSGMFPPLTFAPPSMASLTAGFGPSASMPPDRNRPFRQHPPPPPFTSHQEQSGSFLEEIPGRCLRQSFSTAAAPRPQGPGVVLKRSCRWLAKITAVGAGKGRFALSTSLKHLDNKIMLE